MVNASLIAFLSLVLLVVLIDRKNFRREGILFLRRTQRGVPFIERLGKKRAGFFKAFGDIGIVVSLGAIGLWVVVSKMFDDGRKRAALAAVVIFVAAIAVLGTPIITALLGISGAALAFMASMNYGVIAGSVEASGIQLILPVSIKSSSVLYVPIHYWLVSILVIIIVHEFGHALVSRAEGIPIKSLGYGFLAFIPLAFAEPDEARLRKEKPAKQLRVFAAGSLANFITALVALLFMSSLFIPAGVIYSGRVPGMPSAVLPETGIITGLNNITIRTMEDFSSAVDGLKPNQTIALTVSGRNYTLNTTTSPYNESNAFIGVSFPVMQRIHYDVKENVGNFVGGGLSGLLSSSYIYLFWLFILNMGIGIFNLLPLKPLDGGLMIEQLFKYAELKRWKKWAYILSVITLFMVIFGLFGNSIMGLIRLLLGA